MSEDIIVNRVANSPLVTFNLEEYYHPGERIEFDMKNYLFQEIILKEKDFRLLVKQTDWSIYSGKNIAIVCTVDAIVPTWAYMLIATKISPFANMVVKGNMEVLEYALYRQALSKIEIEAFRDKKIVIKGCSKVEVPESAYVEITNMLLPVAASIMFGEPCSTVPVYKLPK
jgi:hypothetical protein